MLGLFGLVPVLGFSSSFRSPERRLCRFCRWAGDFLVESGSGRLGFRGRGLRRIGKGGGGLLASKAERSEGATRENKAREGSGVGRGLGSDFFCSSGFLGGIRERRSVEQGDEGRDWRMTIKEIGKGVLRGKEGKRRRVLLEVLEVRGDRVVDLGVSKEGIAGREAGDTRTREAPERVGEVHVLVLARAGRPRPAL